MLIASTKCVSQLATTIPMVMLENALGPVPYQRICMLMIAPQHVSPQKTVLTDFSQILSTEDVSSSVLSNLINLPTMTPNPAFLLAIHPSLQITSPEDVLTSVLINQVNFSDQMESVSKIVQSILSETQPLISALQAALLVYMLMLPIDFVLKNVLRDTGDKTSPTPV